MIGSRTQALNIEEEGKVMATRFYIDFYYFEEKKKSFLSSFFRALIIFGSPPRPSLPKRLAILSGVTSLSS